MLQDLFNNYVILVGILGLMFLGVNYFIVESPRMDENNGNISDYMEKSGPFECGFSSFEQSHNPIPIAFILVALLFLPFDLEVSSMLPYMVSIYSVGIYGLIMFILFLLILMVGFIYEFNTKSLSITTILHKKNKALVKNLY
ncbi:unnamed protein product (mitochondrion) [Komagataella phaffii CBS 7435]|uniref:NADH-ubiquinone oxidoreductase chain 3 n=1 Tax=Komagataella phaffii (strain ATCC 76273 / CBS 7435 / CECT 11047 / NRRL Y-11430 / Wegner 21-1) TaxID=981350 RepID=F2R0K7_KOMPC|nr:unnamed protein product [Komagataella phaffii CBS 7435]